MQETHIALAHGNGGRWMRELIDEIFVKHLKNDVQTDAAPLILENKDWLITTDGFTVQPLEFNGGNIGTLAVHGTVNDLAVSGAIPRFLTLNAFIEEGLEIAQLDHFISSLAETAKECKVQIVAGDTKVLRRGEGGGLYLATTGLGEKITGVSLELSHIKSGDKILVSGSVGDHGIAVMLAREQFGLKGDLKSDCANVFPLTSSIIYLKGLRFMRDPTRGGLATVTHEIARATNLGIRLFQNNIPIRSPVQSVCEMLGYDPLYLACEGRVVAILSSEDAETALQIWRNHPQGQDAAIIGEISDKEKHVIIQTHLGGERFLEELEDDPLPRIC
jgi:hydrogenase expression/formation protein HypE